MPVSRQKKRITSAADAATVDPSPPELPSQQEFHTYLRTLAQHAVRTVVEAVMCEELDAFNGDQADSTIILTARAGGSGRAQRGVSPVLSAIPRRERAEVAAELAGIWDQPTKEEAVTQLMADHQRNTASAIRDQVRSLAEEEEKTLTLYEFPAAMHRHIQTTNAIESRLLPREAAHRSE